MKRLFYTISSLVLLCASAQAQESVYPAKEYKGKLYITNGTVHVGNGTVLENATVEVNNGKIVFQAWGYGKLQDGKCVDGRV